MSNATPTNTTSQVVGLIMGVGVSKYVNNLAKAAMPPNTGRYGRIMTFVGSYTISALLAREIQELANEQVAQATLAADTVMALVKNQANAGE